MVCEKLVPALIGRAPAGRACSRGRPSGNVDDVVVRVRAALSFGRGRAGRRPITFPGARTLARRPAPRGRGRPLAVTVPFAVPVAVPVAVAVPVSVAIPVAIACAVYELFFSRGEGGFFFQPTNPPDTKE